MMVQGLLDYIPLWALFLLTIGLSLAADELGFYLGNRRRQRTEPEKEAPVGAMVATTLGLLALLLSFTFSLAEARFDARRDVLLSEANAIGTTWLRAAMLPEPHGSEVRKLLRDYADARLEAVQAGQLRHALEESEKLQNRLWEHAVALGRAQPASIQVGLFVQSLNEMIDLHAKRVQIGVRSRIPPTIWVAIYLVTFLSLGVMGYHAGLIGTARSWAVLIVSTSFAVVILLTADLDRPNEGMLQISQQAMIDLRRSMDVP